LHPGVRERAGLHSRPGACPDRQVVLWQVAAVAGGNASRRPGWVALVTVGRHRQPRACLDAPLPPRMHLAGPPAQPAPGPSAKPARPRCQPLLLSQCSALFGWQRRVLKRGCAFAGVTSSRSAAARVALGRAVVRAIAFCRRRVPGYAAAARPVRPAASATSRSRAGELASNSSLQPTATHGAGRQIAAGPPTLHHHISAGRGAGHRAPAAAPAGAWPAAASAAA
jgi:hypothetical protein